MSEGTSTDIAKIRTEYGRAGLVETDVDPSPLRQIERWLSEAVAAEHPEPTAMNLATVTPEGDPSSRVVLLKGIDDGLVFFTNYESHKGRDLAARPRACANLFWILLERQIRVTGSIAKVSREESEVYFASRPRESRIGAWASLQSSVITGRDELARRIEEVKARFGDGEIPCPPHWGGYRLTPEVVELWQGRPSRLHDRLRYTRVSPSTWTLERLSP